MKPFILLALFAAAYAAAADKGVKITEDYECQKNVVPYQVYLNPGHHICGGALISSTWVVAPAHCYKSQILVHLGEHNLAIKEGTEQFINSAKVIPHPGYSSRNMDNDIMLIKLSKPATLNQYVNTVALPSSCSATHCLMSGWARKGKTNYGPLWCQQVKGTEILSTNSCSKISASLITPNKFCVEQPNNHFCQIRDRVVVCNGQLQGVMSWSSGCAQRNKPAVYTGVCNYSDWIRSTMSSI